MMVRWLGSGDSQVRVKSQKFFELDICARETCLLYFQIILGTTEDSLSNTTVSVSARIRVGKKKLRCDFFLVFVLDTVDVDSSSMSCNKGAGGQTAKVITW